MATIKPRRGTTAPTTGTITQHELAVDTTNKRIYIGAADGSGTLIGAAPAGSDTQVQFNDGGNLGGDSGLTYNKTTDTLVAGRVETTGFEAKTVGGDEGGEILLGKPVTNTTLSGTGVTIDVYQNKLRIFEQGGTARGAYIDITSAGAGVSTNLLASSASPGGSDTHVQFNDGSTFGGDAGLTYNKTTDTLTVTGDVAVNGGDLTTSSATASLFNATATTLNIGGAGTSISIGAATGSTTFNHGVVLSDKTLSRMELLDYFERAVITSIAKAGGLTLDLSSGQVFIVSLSGSVTSITINNIPDNASANAVGFTIIFIADGTARTITWPASVKWPGGTAPTMTSTNNKKDILSFLSDDAGTTWYGFVGGQNF
jgi:hypothetical protein